MKKPQPKTVSILNFNECVEYIEGILGYDLRDTLGKFKNYKENKDKEYRDWWHFLLEHMDIHNPCNITISSYLLEDGNEWQNEITQKFIDEFGDEQEYYVSW